MFRGNLSGIKFYRFYDKNGIKFPHKNTHKDFLEIKKIILKNPALDLDLLLRAPIYLFTPHIKYFLYNRGP